MRCSNRINAILVLAQKSRGFFCPLSGHTDLFGRCRLEIGFHFLPFFECTHCSGSCHSECREPGKADTRLANGPSGQLPTFPPLHRYLSESLQGSTKRAKPKTGKLHFQHLAAWYGRMRAYSEESQNWASLLFVIYISPHRNRHIHIVGISCQ